MLFCVTGVNFKTAPIEIREMLSFSEEEMKDAYSLLLAKEEIEECVILSTCNRVEIYALIKDGRVNIIRDFMRDYHKYSGNLDELLYCKNGNEAVMHLCMVASGLDSMVLGETQIFGQVKDAFAKAVQNNAVHHAFEHLFSQTYSIVKKVRSKTGIGEKNISVSYAAVKLAQSIFNKLEDKSVMILGAGEMSELTVRNLISAGVSNVIVANRTFQKAVELAEKFKGTPIMLHEINEYITKTDILISSISAQEYIIKTTDMEINAIKRNKRPLFIVDISVPRSVDPDTAKIANTHLFNIDDLRAVSESNIEARKIEAEKGIELIKKKIPQIVEYIKCYDIIPTIVSIRSKAEEIRKNGMTQCVEELGIDKKEIEIIESMTKTIVNKILHHSEIMIREYSSNLKHAG